MNQCPAPASQAAKPMPELPDSCEVATSVSANSTRRISLKKRKMLKEDCSINFSPNLSNGLDPEQLKQGQQQTSDIMRMDELHRDTDRLVQLTNITFMNRRHLINSRASVHKVRAQYPGVFTADGVVMEYTSMVQLPASSHMMPALCKHASVMCSRAGML